MIIETEAGLPASVCCPIISLFSSLCLGLLSLFVGAVEFGVYQCIVIFCFLLVYCQLIFQYSQFALQFGFVGFPAGKILVNHGNSSLGLINVFLDVVQLIVDELFLIF